MANYSIYTEGKSFFYRIDPRPKLLLLVVVVFLVMTSSNPLFNAFMFGASLLFAMITVDYKKILKTFKVFIPLFSLILILWPLFQHQGEVLFEWWIITITYGGIMYAIAMFFRVLAMLTVSLIAFMSIKSADLVTLMDKVGLPYTYSYAAMISLNFLPEFATSAITVLNAQQARGLDIKKQNFLLGIKNYAALMPPLMTLVFKKADTLSLSMDSLAFGAFKTRTYLRSEDLKMNKMDWVFISIVLLFGIGVYVITNVFLG